MNVRDLEARYRVENEADLLTRLCSSRKGDFAAFVLWHEDGGPSLWVLINGDVAYLHFFPDESRRHPGFQPTNMSPPSCHASSIFFSLEAERRIRSTCRARRWLTWKSRTRLPRSFSENRAYLRRSIGSNFDGLTHRSEVAFVRLLDRSSRAMTGNHLASWCAMVEIRMAMPTPHKMANARTVKLMDHEIERRDACCGSRWCAEYAEGVALVQPRVGRFSGLPWVGDINRRPTLKELYRNRQAGHRWRRCNRRTSATLAG